MRKEKFIILFVLVGNLIIGNSLGDGIRTGYPKHYLFFVPQGLIQSNFNSFGNSGIFNSVSNLGSLNPAALDNFENISLGFSYQFETAINDAYVNDTKYFRNTLYLPQSAGFVLPFKNFHFGLAFNQIYNSDVSLGLIPITTNENPEGTGEFYEPVFKLSVYNISATASMPVLEINSNSNIIFGLELGLNFLDTKEKIFTFSSEMTTVSPSISLGLIFNLNKYSNTQIGVSYNSGAKFSKEMKNNYTNSNGSLGIISIYDPDPKYYGQVPSTLKIDFNSQISEHIRMLNNFNYRIYDENYSAMNNQIDFSGSMVFEYSESIIPSCGFIYTDQSYVSTSEDFLSEFSAFFVTVGLSYKVNNLTWNFALADCHFTAEKRREQLVFKTEFGYNL